MLTLLFSGLSITGGLILVGGGVILIISGVLALLKKFK